MEKLNPFVRLAAEVSSTNIRECRVVGLDNRLFFVNSGSAVLNVEGLPHTLSAGALVYIPAYVDYEFHFLQSQIVSLTVLNFDFDAERAVRREILKPVPFEEFERENLYTGYAPEEFFAPMIINDGASLGKDIRKIRMLFFNKDAYYRDFASALLKSVLLKIAAHKRDNVTNESALGIISYVKEHYAERIVAKDLSIRFGYHPNHINRLVKFSTGMGFKEFLIHYRLKVAKDLLVSTDDSITSISESCGFATPSYFSEIFMKQMKMTPRDYRSSIRTGV